MNRKVLALIIPALLAAGAAHAAEVYNKDGNKLDLYGKVDGLHYFSDDANSDGDQTYMRMGFKGETQVNDMITGYGQWEYQIQANGTEGDKGDSWTRLAFAGIKVGDYGSFDYGRNYGVMYDVEGWTDMLPEFGGDSYTKADNFMTGRANGVATYRNTDFFGMVNGLNFALQYQGANEQSGDEIKDGFDQEGNGNGRNVQNSNGDGFGLSSTYDLGMGVSFGAAYTTSDRTNEQTTKGGDVAGGDKAPTRTIRGDGTAPVDSKARHAARKDEMFLPATSIITGVLINGLEAPTSLSSKAEPMPVTMRIKKDIIMPNNFTMDLRDCNLLGSAVGDLASQRAYIRATSISCVNSKGKAFDVKLEAYAVSENDGKNGIRGNLISRNGNAIAGSAFAGGLSALAGSLSPSKVSSLNIDPNSTAEYQSP